MKQKQLEKIELFLLREGYILKNLSSTCFDVLARKQDNILLIKVLEDANSISKEFSEEMISVASYIAGTPLIVAGKAGSKLQDNIVYVRFGIWTITPGMLMACVKNKFPFVKSSQAGLTASVKGSKLKQKREDLGYSLNSMSRLLGVSVRMVSRYESRDSEVTINKAMRIYDAFGKNVFKEINIFDSKAQAHGTESHGTYSSDVAIKYVQLGFEAADTKRTPFDVIAKKEQEVILTGIGDKINPEVQSLSRLIDADNLVIFNRKKPKDIPSIAKQEFLEFEKAEQVIKYLKEF